MLVIGGPIALINKLTGRRFDDEVGGKIFALSFFVGPMCAAPLFVVFGRENLGFSVLAGYVGAIFLLNHWFSKGD